MSAWVEVEGHVYKLYFCPQRKTWTSARSISPARAAACFGLTPAASDAPFSTPLRQRSPSNLQIPPSWTNAATAFRRHFTAATMATARAMMATTTRSGLFSTRRRLRSGIPTGIRSNGHRWILGTRNESRHCGGKTHKASLQGLLGNAASTIESRRITTRVGASG